MFDFVRNHTRLMLGLVLLVIFPSFVFFGVQGYSRFGDDTTREVAEVGGRAITQGELDSTHQRQVEQYRAQMPDVDLNLLNTPQMKRETLDALVRERVTLLAADKLHLSVTDERLQRIFLTDPQFAPLRNADGSVNRDLLSSQGMTSEVFEQRLRQELAMRQVLSGVGSSTLVPAVVATTALDAALQRREVMVERFDTKAFEAQVQPTPAELEAYYKANAALFKAPEQAEIEYVVLDVEALKAGITVPEADARKFYADNEARYMAPQERRASHILVKADKDAPAADRAKARAKAQALLAEVRAKPDTFGAVARRSSDDPGSAANGGDLDFFGRGAMVKPFEDTVFGQKAGDISDLVETDFGFHIIRLDAVRGGEKKPFESVRAEIEDELRRQMAQKAFAPAAEQFTNTVFEQADSLQPVVDKLKLPKKTATVARTPAPGATGVLASAKFLEAVFKPDALREKRNTVAVDVGPSQLASARVVNYLPERTRPLAEVQEQVTQRVRSTQAAALARKAGLARLAAAQQGIALAGAPVVVSRVQAQGLPRPVIVDVLKADLARGPVTTGIDLGDAGYAVVRVLRIVPREAIGEEADRGKSIVAQATSAAESAAYYDALKARYKVAFKPLAPAEAAASAASGP